MTTPTTMTEFTLHTDLSAPSSSSPSLLDKFARKAAKTLLKRQRQQLRQEQLNREAELRKSQKQKEKEEEMKKKAAQKPSIVLGLKNSTQTVQRDIFTLHPTSTALSTNPSVHPTSHFIIKSQQP